MQRYFAVKKNGDYFCLSDDDFYHIKIVMRMKDIDLIEVVFDKQLYICKFVDNFNVLPISLVTNDTYIKRDVTIIVPLLKDTKMALILQKCTELGVKKIIVVMLSRCVVKVDGPAIERKLLRWKRIVKEASEQAKRNEIPSIDYAWEINDLKVLDGKKLVCSTIDKTISFKKTLKNIHIYDKINILMGPEGGLTLTEEQTLVTMGFIPVSLGNLIMRVETVPIFLLSVLNYESME
ncbi:MAG: RsmE family RNA methyltransferase [Bacilli bacterium]